MAEVEEKIRSDSIYLKVKDDHHHHHHEESEEDEAHDDHHEKEHHEHHHYHKEKDHSHYNYKKGRDFMHHAQPVNVFTTPTVNPVQPQDGLGWGLGGGGIVGGLLLGTLLRNNGGLFGGYGSGSGINELTTIEALRDLGDLKKDVAVSSCDTQAAIAASQAAISQQINAGQIADMQGKFAIQQSLCEGFNATQREGYQNTQAIISAVTNEAEKTRAQAQQFNDAWVTRKLNEQAAELAELRNEKCRQAEVHNITMQQVVNQNQNNLQNQSLDYKIQSLYGLFDQNIRATNQAINIGGRQIANPDNNNTNVKG